MPDLFRSPRDVPVTLGDEEDAFAPCPRPIIIEATSRIDAYGADVTVCDPSEAFIGFDVGARDFAEASLGTSIGGYNLAMLSIAEASLGTSIGGYTTGMGSTIV